MKCPRCELFYKLYPLIDGKHKTETYHCDPIKCAFDNENQIFDIHNWNCKTIELLREYIVEKDLVVWNEDHNAALIKIPKPEEYTHLLL